jgi:AraC-like DNA-binding protein
MGRHRHDGLHELVLVLDGRLRTEIGGVERVAEAGTAVVHAAGVDHVDDAIGPRPLEIVYVAFAAPWHAPSLWQREDAGGRIGLGLRWAVDALRTDSPSGRAAAAGLLTAVLHEFAHPPRRDADLLARVRDFARPRLAEPLTLDDLAVAAGCSRFHFARRFREASGLPPMRWLRELRLEAARSLLAATSLSVEQVGERVGFADRFHFARAMRQASGRPPSAWRSA